MEMIYEVDVVDQKMKLPVPQRSAQRQTGDQLCNSIFVRRIDSGAEHRPGHRTIHCTRIDVSEAETLRQLTSHAALSRSSRSVNGDYTMSILGLHLSLRARRSFSRNAQGSKRAIILRPARPAQACRLPAYWCALAVG